MLLFQCLLSSLSFTNDLYLLHNSNLKFSCKDWMLVSFLMTIYVFDQLCGVVYIMITFIHQEWGNAYYFQGARAKL